MVFGDTKRQYRASAYVSQITKNAKLGFRALLTAGEREVRFERVTG